MTNHHSIIEDTDSCDWSGYQEVIRLRVLTCTRSLEIFKIIGIKNNKVYRKKKNQVAGVDKADFKPQKLEKQISAERE